jgi:hypothetical protein
MSRNFHNVHVYAPTKRAQAQVVRAVLAHAKLAGFKRVKRTMGADRVIRLGGRAPWFSVDDDGYGAGELAAAIAKATKLPVLEAYCEASSRVWLDFYARGRRAGGWAEPGKRGPAAKLVAPILATGTPADLASRWADGIRQVFPETALAVAAKQVGIRVPQMFGETNLRAVTIALARTRATWTPRYQQGAPAFRVGWGSNCAWGGRHLVFEGATEKHHLVHVTSVGGPGRGLSIAFGGSAIDGGHIELLEVSHDSLELVRDGTTWRDPAVVVPAGFIEAPDTFSMGRREADKARSIESKLEWSVDVTYRALVEGDCELVTTVTSGASHGVGSLALHVNWKPWRPSVTAEHVDDCQLFAMHRKEHAIAHVALRGSLADAWLWARPHVEAWAAAHGDPSVRVMRAFEVLLESSDEAAIGPMLDRVSAFVPDGATPFQVTGRRWSFGTATFAPYRMDARDQLAVHLVLSAYSPEGENGEAIAQLEAICDDAIARGAAHSALVYQHQHRPDATTPFEKIAVHNGEPTELSAWHETHVRGVDKRIWLSAALAAGLDRANVPEYVSITSVGSGLRLQMADDRPRSDLEAVIAALGPLVPSQSEADRWTGARDGA